MMMRPIVFLGWFVAIVLSSCGGERPAASQKFSPPNLDELYRLPVDSRLSLAFRDIDAVLGVSGMPEAMIRFENDGWGISLQEERIATLPALPDFRDLSNASVAYAKKRLVSAPVKISVGGADEKSSESRASLFPEELFGELAQLQKRWESGEKQIALLRESARLTALLAFQSLRQTRVADAVDAHALALSAIAQALNGERDPLTDAVLAYAMGYTASSAREAAKLPPGDPLHLFLENRNAELKELFERSDSSLWTRYLWLLRAAEEREYQPWFDAAEKAFAGGQSISLLQAALEINAFETDYPIALQLQRLVFQKVAQRSGVPAEESPLAFALRILGDIVKQYSFGELRFGEADELLAKLPAGGALEGRDTYRAFYQSHLIGAAEIVGNHLVYRYGDLKAAQAFGGEIQNVVTPEFRDFNEYYDLVVSGRSGKKDEQRIFSYLGRAKILGGELFNDLNALVGQLYTFASPKTFKALSLIAQRMDTRPSYRMTLASAARSTLMDIKLSGALYHSVVEHTSVYDDPNDRAWILRFEGRDRELEELLALPELQPQIRLGILKMMRDRKTIPRHQFEAKLDELLAKTPDDLSLVSSKYWSLRQNGKLDEALSLVEQWLKQPHSRAFEVIAARNMVAEVLLEQKKFEDALKKLTPIPGGFHGGAVSLKIQAHEGLGQFEQALELAEGLVERYGDNNWTIGEQARVLWRLGRSDEAAQLLRTAREQFNLNDWKEILGTNFTKAFPGGNDSAASDAFKALIGKFPAYQLSWMLKALPTERSELAYQLLSLVPADNSVIPWYLQMESYHYLSRARGVDAAGEWIKSMLPPGSGPQVGKLFYDFGAFDLLWSAIPVETDSEFVWLPRAMASLRKGWDASKYQQILQTRYQKNSTDKFFNYGKYLLGGISQQSMLDLVDSPQTGCEVFYFLGLRSESEGKIGEAITWYRRSVESGDPGQIEWSWAWSRLQSYLDAGVSVEVLSARSSSESHPSSGDSHPAL